MSEINFTSIGSRLREERDRIGMSQDGLAVSCGVSRRTLVAWEKGDQFPNAGVLALMAGAGLDVLYVLTASRSAPMESTLSADEQTLLNNFKKADQKARSLLIGVSELASGVPTAVKSNAIQGGVHIGGDVGQSITGDITYAAPITFNVGKGRK